MNRFIFGPVNSRRLGISLGIDLLPYKTCSLDCVYCECSKTTKYCVEREDFFNWEDITQEIDNHLKSCQEFPDYITFSGSGEPLLYKNIKKIIDHIKTNYPQLKVALLTNSTLLHLEGVIDEIKGLDLFIPSLDSATQVGFEEIDKPAPNLNIDVKTIIESIKKAKEIIKGDTWLEIFIVPGINDSEKELNELKKAIEYIKPDKIQINSLERPGTQKWIEPLTKESKKNIENFLNGEIVERNDIIDSSSKGKVYGNNNSLKGKIVDYLTQKEATLEQISSQFYEYNDNVEKILHFLLVNSVIEKTDRNGKTIYKKIE